MGMFSLSRVFRRLTGSFLSGPSGSVLKLLVPREEKNLKLLMAETRLRRYVPRYHGTVDKDGSCILPATNLRVLYRKDTQQLHLDMLLTRLGGNCAQNYADASSIPRYGKGFSS